MSSCLRAPLMNAASRSRAFSGLTTKRSHAGRVGLTRVVGLEQLERLLHQLRVLGDDAEAAALGDVEPGEVEAVDVQHAAVDDHHLAVIANEIVGGPGHGHPGRQQPQFELSQDLVAAGMGVGDEGANGDAAADGRFEGPGNLLAVEAKNENVDGLFCLLDGRDDRSDAGVGLNDEFHTFMADLSPGTTSVSKLLASSGWTDLSSAQNSA